MEREAALDWARRARETRFRLREEISSTAIDLEQALREADEDELVGAVRLGWVLESLPGSRKIDTRRHLARLGLDPSMPVGSLDSMQRATILEEFGPGPVEGVASSVGPLPPGTSVIVVSGPGGVGKGTIVQRLVEQDPTLWVSRSWTTRERRSGEAADAYHFAAEREFLERVEEDGFLEWTRFLDYYQGSPVPDPPEGCDVLFEIDVRGAANVKRLYPDALLVFVDTADRAIQESRLRGRGDNEERIRQRLEKAEEEVRRASTMEFTHLVNDDLDRAVAELARLIQAHRSR
jgi:guanylate kinase